jgi:membrane protein DedA with SNARE-associated domain
VTTISSMNEYSALFLMAAIIFGAFISEDGATITAVTLAASKLLDPRLAFVSAFAGLWAGDLGMYALARSVGPSLVRHPWFARWFPKQGSDEGVRVQGEGQLALAVSRFFPGTRLPAYLSAGFRRMPLPAFLGITALTAAAWVLLAFLVIRLAPSHADSLAHELEVLSLVGLSLYASLTLLRRLGPGASARFAVLSERMRRWEFWPAWLFYIPVAGFCAWLGIRFRGLDLPTVANPSQKNGGIVGESKSEILRTLMETSPELTADAFLIPAGSEWQRYSKLREICDENAIEFPFVLKPDTGQRGAGFKKIKSFEEARGYLAKVSAPLVVQRYVPGPKEAGIFYYRFPGEERGHIFGITRKEFPKVVGDGVRTVRELVKADPRARLISQTYLKRFEEIADEVLETGEILRLVEAGNHCQGCIFLDGADLLTEELREVFDGISRKLPGFFVGRYDVRYESDSELRAGRNFKIIELNGAASEATNIYDSSNSLWSAYTTLYRQWEIVYRIGAENRRRGNQPAGFRAVFKDWQAFSSQSIEFPVAD